MTALAERQLFPIQGRGGGPINVNLKLTGKIVRPVGHIRAVIPDARATADAVKRIVEVRQRGIGTVCVTR